MHCVLHFIFRSNCQNDFRLFPEDEQVCNFLAEQSSATVREEQCWLGCHQKDSVHYCEWDEPKLRYIYLSICLSVWKKCLPPSLYLAVCLAVSHCDCSQWLEGSHRFKLPSLTSPSLRYYHPWLSLWRGNAVIGSSLDIVLAEIFICDLISHIRTLFWSHEI